MFLTLLSYTIQQLRAEGAVVRGGVRFVGRAEQSEMQPVSVDPIFKA